jgi:hypothetical protein
VIEDEKIYGDEVFVDGSDSNSYEIPISSVVRTRYLIISVHYTHAPFVCTPVEASALINNLVFPEIRGVSNSTLIKSSPLVATDK